VTEEVWSWAFAEETGHASIHRAPWPDAAEFEAISAPAEPDGFAVAVAAYAAIHKAKADAEVSAGREVLELRLAANGKTLAKLAPVLEDVLAAARARHHALEPAELADGVFEVRAARFAERAP
jgi:valyl-tRNA synthetase